MTAQTQIKPRYVAQEATAPTQIAALQALRHLAFFGATGHDEDAFDPLCRHFAVRDTQSGQAVGAFRAMVMPAGAAARDSYSAQFYDLSPLARFDLPVMELGRVCVHPECNDPDVLRLAWGALAGIVAAQNVGMIFGCSSFVGADVAAHSAHLCHLRDTHLGPKTLRPLIKSSDAVPLDTLGTAEKAVQMPPLLRTYLMMGGWVGDHAVRDPEMGTTHIFTALEIAAIPANRKRLLQAWQP